MTSKLAAVYKSGSQRARVVTESWGEQNLYCPNCSSAKLQRLSHNTKASDFLCPNCRSSFQLKGQKKRFGNSIADGAYGAMMEAIRDDETPNFFFMHYDLATWSIRNLLLIPHFAFPPSAIIKRLPLSATARRAGWVGCKIALHRIPAEARIEVVKTVHRRGAEAQRGIECGVENAGRGVHARGKFARPADGTSAIQQVWKPALQDEVVITPPEVVRAQFKRVKPLGELKPTERGWTLDVLNIVQRLGKPEFRNEDVYAFAGELEKLHPGNRHIKDKIRQRLQVLRDGGFLVHVGRSEWRVK